MSLVPTHASGKPHNAAKPWVDPEVVELDVKETASFPGAGGDGGAHADCSRS